MFVGDDIREYFDQYNQFVLVGKQIAWRYELRIEDYDLTLYCYSASIPLFEISHDVTEVATFEKAKAERLTLRNPSLQIFDDEDGKHQQYFLDWKNQIIPTSNGIPNGLIRLPSEYTRKLTFQPLSFKGEKLLEPIVINCWVNKVGELEFSRAESKLLEFPINLIEQRTI